MAQIPMSEADRRYFRERIVPTILGWDAMGTMERARALRSYVAERYVLASTRESLLDQESLATAPLEECISRMESNTGGVWCHGVSLLLTRIYTAADIPSYVHNYGLPDPLYCHAVNLVEVDGDLYMQDAYFNVEYVDAAGQPVAYCEQLAALGRRKVTRLKQSSPLRRCVFASKANISLLAVASG
jgi:hypothetical protein